MNIVPTFDTETAQRLDDGLWFKDAIIYQLHVKALRSLSPPWAEYCSATQGVPKRYSSAA